MATIEMSSVASVTELTPFENEYVYDIGVESRDPYFFANDVLVHNSCYFSAWPMIKQDVETGKMKWDKDIAVQLYDSIADQVNESFPPFMNSAFNVPLERGTVIKGGREIVASSGLFITKKRYAVLFYDKDGKRYDSETSPGKVKAMGLDLKRSDTPVVIQQFLSNVLDMLLTGKSQESMIDYIREFRLEFKSRPAWEKGSPKRVNNLSKYKARKEAQGKVATPGHVTASLNWNTLLDMYNDKHTTRILDGGKIIVCKLRDNPLRMTSVAYPIDEMRLPDWFKELPFDEALMESTVIDEKLGNLIGVLDWDLSSTRADTTFNSLFDWGE